MKLFQARISQGSLVGRVLDFRAEGLGVSQGSLVGRVLDFRAEGPGVKPQFRSSKIYKLRTVD